MKNQGVLFVATGASYVKAGIRAAQTVLRYCPGLPIHLGTDSKSFDAFFNKSPWPFSSIDKIDNPHRRSKVDYLQQTPFENTLYLDTDTALTADISESFTLMERSDIALCHAHRRSAARSANRWRIEVPSAYPEFNSGVIMFRKAPAVLRLLQEWSAAYHEAGQRHDQPTLRELLWLSNLRIATLPPEYNTRMIKYRILWSKSEATVKILHLKSFHRGRFSWLFRYPLRKWNRLRQKLGAD